MKKKIMCFGTFDLFHKGHSYFLNRAKKLGEYLIVVVARDGTVKHLKGRSPLYDEEQRKKEVEKQNIADKVVLGNIKDKFKVIKENKPDVIALGYDQKFYVEKLKKKFDDIKIIRLGAFKPEKYKSSILKKINKKIIKKD